MASSAPAPGAAGSARADVKSEAAAGGGKGGKCRIIYESAPAVASIGRMTFNAASPTAAAGAAAAVEAAARPRKSKAPPAEPEMEQVVSDADMARAFLRGPAAAAYQATEEGKKKKAKLK